MISQIFLLSPRGDTIIFKDFKGNVPKVCAPPPPPPLFCALLPPPLGLTLLLLLLLLLAAD